MHKRSTNESPDMKYVMQVMSWAWDNRKDKNKPVTIDFGYTDTTTNKTQGLRITVEESKYDISEFGGIPDQVEKKEDDKWQLGI